MKYLKLWFTKKKKKDEITINFIKFYFSFCIKKDIRYLITITIYSSILVIILLRKFKKFNHSI